MNVNHTVSYGSRRFTNRFVSISGEQQLHDGTKCFMSKAH